MEEYSTRTVAIMLEPNFSDVIEISDIEFSEKLSEITKTRDFEKYGRDGNIVVWQGNYTYRNVNYIIALLKYYILGIPISEIRGMNQYGKWFVLEYTEGTEEIVVKYKETHEYSNEILYRDTLHSYNENQTLEEMFYEMANYAKKDIDELLDNKDINQEP